MVLSVIAYHPIKPNGTGRICMPPSTHEGLLTNMDNTDHFLGPGKNLPKPRVHGQRALSFLYQTSIKLKLILGVLKLKIFFSVLFSTWCQSDFNQTQTDTTSSRHTV